MSIRYIEIQNTYLENKRKNYRFSQIEKFVDLISKKNTSSSIFEVLREHDIKIYFDIEKIPVDQPKLIYDIIGDLRTWFVKKTNKELGNYILTNNSNSCSHKGLSYHLIFYELYTNMINIKNLLNNFLEDYQQYVPYIDGSVYSSNRLFRSINQIGVNKKTNKLSNSSEDMHNIINTKINNENIKKTVIQYIDDSKLLKHYFKCVKRPKSKQISDFGNYKQKPTIIIHNHINNNEEKKNKTLLPKENDTINDDIYAKAFALKLKNTLNEYGKKYINELLEYYDKNKTFDGYAQTKYQILSILNLLE